MNEMSWLTSSGPNRRPPVVDAVVELPVEVRAVARSILAKLELARPTRWWRSTPRSRRRGSARSAGSSKPPTPGRTPQEWSRTPHQPSASNRSSSSSTQPSQRPTWSYRVESWVTRAPSTSRWWASAYGGKSLRHSRSKAMPESLLPSRRRRWRNGSSDRDLQRAELRAVDVAGERPGEPQVVLPMVALDRHEAVAGAHVLVEGEAGDHRHLTSGVEGLEPVPVEEPMVADADHPERAARLVVERLVEMDQHRSLRRDVIGPGSRRQQQGCGRS